VLHNRGFPTVAGDFDGDGNMDLFGLTYECQGQILWNVSNVTSDPARITWESVLQFSGTQSHSYHTLAAADIDNDTRDEILVPAQISVQDVYIYEFLENGSFVRKQNLGKIGTQPYSTFGDLNGDGWLDLVISGYYANVWWLPNLGNGTLVPLENGVRPRTTPPTHEEGGWLFFAPLAAELACMDIDQDGRDDLILITEQYNEVMFFWSSYVPPSNNRAEKSSGLGLDSMTAIAIITLPILLWAILEKKIRINRRT
jgi:hypothetical protein